MSRRITRLQLRRALEFAFHSRPIPLVARLDRLKTLLRCGNRLRRRRLSSCRFPLGFGGWNIVRGQSQVAVDNARIGQRKVWVKVYRLPEKYRRSFQPLPGEFAPVKPALQICLIGIGALGITLGESLLIVSRKL